MSYVYSNTDFFFLFHYVTEKHLDLKWQELKCRQLFLFVCAKKTPTQQNEYTQLQPFQSNKQQSTE